MIFVAIGGIMTRQLGNDLRRPEILRAHSGAPRGGGLDDLGPVIGVNAAAVAPLTNRDTGFADVGGHCLGIAVPDVEDFLKVM